MLSPAAQTRPPVIPLQIDPVDLTQRIAQATSADTCKGMFFNGLFYAVERARGVAGLDSFKAVAQGQKFVDFFNYPIADFLPLAWHVAEQLGGGTTPLALEAGIRSLGRQSSEDFLSTAVGKTLLMLSNDPKRLMNSAAAGYKTAVSYGVRSMVWKGPTHCVFSMRRDFMPHPYHEGLLTHMLTAVGARSAQVKGLRVGLLDTDYETTWS